MYKIYIIGRQNPVECSDALAAEIMAKWKDNPASHEVVDTDISVCAFKIKDIKSFENESPEDSSTKWTDSTGEFFRDWLKNAKQSTDIKAKQNKVVFKLFFMFVNGNEPTDEDYNKYYYGQAKKFFDENPYATLLSTVIMKKELKDKIIKQRNEPADSIKFKLLQSIINDIIKTEAWDKEFMDNRMKYEEAYGD